MNNQFIQRVIFDWNRIDNDSYLKGIEAFKGIEKLDFNKPITFFVGENGSGKSTLLEALAVAHGFNPEGGTKNRPFPIVNNLITDRSFSFRQKRI